MKRAAIVFILLLFIVLTSTHSHGQQSWTSSPQMAIAELENRWLQHLDDPTALEEILADDFVHVLPAGSIDKQQHIDYLKTHPRPKQETRRFEDLKVRLYGDTAIANGVVVTTGTNGAQRTIFTDVFVKRNGRWQAVNAQENPEPAQR